LQLSGKTRFSLEQQLSNYAPIFAKLLGLISIHKTQQFSGLLPSYSSALNYYGTLVITFSAVASITDGRHMHFFIPYRCF
jgi:hypothetical protein